MTQAANLNQYEEIRAQAIASFSPEELAAEGAFDPQLFFSLVMPKSFYKPFSDFHMSLLEVISNNQFTGQRQVRVGPRGWGKSTTITEGGSIYICCRNPYLPEEKRYKFILIVSETTTQAEARLATIKNELESNLLIAKYYPHAYGRGRVWRTDMIVTANNICIACAGMNTSTRGIKFENRRPDVEIFDDADSINTATSPTMSADLEDRFGRDFMKLGHDNTDVLVVGTIISKMCLCYKLLNSDQYAAWEGKLYRAFEAFPENMDMWEKFARIFLDRKNRNRAADAEAFYIQNKAEMDKGAISGWPEVLSVYDLMKEYYTDGRRVFLTEKQNQIIESDLAYFQPERYTYLSPDQIDHFLEYNPVLYMYIDPTGGESKSKSQYTQRGPDKFSVSVIAKVSNDIYFLRDFYAGVLRQSQQFEVIGKILSKLRITRMTIENNGGQVHYVTALKKFLGELYADENWRAHAETKHILMPRSINSTVNKEQRISALEPHLANGTLMLPDEMLESRSEYRELADELDNWPNSTYDDGLDSLSGGFFSCFKNFRFAYLYHGDA